MKIRAQSSNQEMKQMLYQLRKGYGYLNNKYSEQEWFYRLSDFSQFDENRLKLKIRGQNHSSRYIRVIFSKNILKSTFSALILPCIVFSLVSLIVFLGVLCYHRERYFTFVFENDFMRGFYIFLAIFFFLMSIILFVKAFILQEKCYFTRVHGRKGYRILKRSEYQEMMNYFDHHERHSYTTFQPITSRRLIIRELTEFDALDYYDMAKNSKVSRYMGWDNHTQLQESIELIIKTRAEYQKGLIYRLALEEKSSKRVIGYIGLSRYDLSETTCQIVYALAEEYWGQGLIKEAVVAFVKKLVETGKTTIYASHVAENVASGKVLMHCGFVRDPLRDTKMMIHDEEKNIISYILEERKENL
ncbi:MAG: GNAT family N-acetyltransferase [Bacilli bacterium]